MPVDGCQPPEARVRFQVPASSLQPPPYGVILLQVAVLLTVGKYLFLVCLYVFVLAVFRGMMRQLAAEAEKEPSLEPGAEPREYGKSTRREAPPRAWVPEAAEPSSASRLQQPAFAVPRLVVLEAVEGDAPPGVEIPLSAAVTIGRDDENSITLNDRYVSGRHALICLREGRRILVDRGSTNGSFVNGRPVDAEVELHDGDRIALGRTVLEYRAS